MYAPRYTVTQYWWRLPWNFHLIGRTCCTKSKLYFMYNINFSFYALQEHVCFHSLEKVFGKANLCGILRLRVVNFGIHHIYQTCQHFQILSVWNFPNTQCSTAKCLFLCIFVRMNVAVVIMLTNGYFSSYDICGLLCEVTVCVGT